MFQNLTVERHVSTPHILLVKIVKIRTNWRTNRRNICFWLADERKERFAQKFRSSLTSVMEFEMSRLQSRRGALSPIFAIILSCKTCLNNVSVWSCQLYKARNDYHTDNYASNYRSSIFHVSRIQSEIMKKLQCGLFRVWLCWLRYWAHFPQNMFLVGTLSARQFTNIAESFQKSTPKFENAH